MRWLLRLGAFAAIVYFAMVAMLFTTQRSMQYPASARVTNVEEARWRVSATSPSRRRMARPCGPSGTRPRRARPRPVFPWQWRQPVESADRARLLARDGRGVLLVSYRGYSGSTGSPTEEGLHRDARAAYAFAREHVPVGKILGYGRIAWHRR